MSTGKPRVSIASLVDGLLARFNISASARVVRVDTSIFVLVTVEKPTLAEISFEGPSSVPNMILVQLRERLHPQLTVEGIYWNAALQENRFDPLLQKKKALSDKIKALRMSRTDIGLASD